MFFCHNQQKVPPEIVMDLGEELWKNTFLVGSSGEKWEVSILKKGNDIYLQTGWQKFLKDNTVMLEELLVFTYNGENKFQVQIFGKNGLERPCFKNVQEQEEAQEEVAAVAPLTAVKRKRGRPRKVPFPESECFKKEKVEVAATIVAKRNDGRTRKSPAGERVCFRKKEEVAATIMSMCKPRKNPVRQRLSVKKEEAKAAATMAAAINKGRTRENPAGERVCIMKQEKVAVTMGRTKKYPVGERVCIKKEDAKAAETIVAERKKGIPRKNRAPAVILVN